MNVVRELRQRVGLTQALLARLVDVSPATIYAYETDRTSPTLEMLRRLADATGLEVLVTIRDPNRF